MAKFKGKFITFEGGDGSGKSTQMRMLREHLVARGYDVVATVEPGGTKIGDRLREILLRSESKEIRPDAELFLYAASRAQLMGEVIIPSLAAGKIVLCDRFTDSTIAYQGHGRGLDMKLIRKLNEWATRKVKPGLTILLDCSESCGLRRTVRRFDAGVAPGEDRFEKEGVGFHKKVRNGYLDIARRDPRRVKVVNGEKEIGQIEADIRGIAMKFLKKHGKAS
jgi:dTMP kinase